MGPRILCGHVRRAPLRHRRQHGRGRRDRPGGGRRSDVLCDTTGPLAAATEVTGPVELVLFASSSALDTDFTGKLVDVHPDGPAALITDGILRARYRRSTGEPELLDPGR